MKNSKVSLRIGDLELRSTKTFSNPHKKYLEIVKWYSSSKMNPDEQLCFTIAYWSHSSDSPYDLKFVGDRPLKPDINKDIFWILVEFGYKLNDILLQD